MNNLDIRFSSLASSPSDYDSPDGQLAFSLNLLNEDGALRPIASPSVVINNLGDNTDVIFIHKTAQFTHYISSTLQFINSSTHQLISWFSISENGAPSESHPLLQLPDNSVKQVTSLGNTIIFLTANGLHYFLWRADTGTYDDLGSNIPFPDISFALGKSIAVDLGAGFYFDLSMSDAQKDYVLKVWGGGAGGNSVFGNVVSEVNSLVANPVFAGINNYTAAASKKGMFTQPFFIRFALRLFDGSYSMHSAPILMLPNSGAPQLPFSFSFSDNIFHASTTIYHNALFAFFKIASLNGLDKWKDIVSHIDIFVSAPIPTFKQSGSVNPVRRTSASTLDIFSHFGVVSEDDTRGRDNRPVRYSTVGVRDNTAYIFNSGNCENHLSAGAGISWGVDNIKQEDIEKNILSSSSSVFYHVASLEIAKIETGTFNKIPIEEGALTNLLSRRQLPDDYISHHHLIPNVAYPYNARLNLANIAVAPFNGFSIPQMSQFFAPKTVADGVSVRAFVRVRRNSSSVWTSTSFSFPDSLSNAFPRFLFYPDSTADQLILAQFNGNQLLNWFRIPLSAHDSLEGAFWFRGLSSDIPEAFSDPLPSDISDVVPGASVIHMENKIYSSDVNNPFYFPLSGINTVGTGTIVGLSSAAKALSQGQFGQFPLYAFTNEGVWAIEVASNGSFVARQPITRDVCINPSAITQLDNAVVFPSARGLMLLAGSNTSEISDIIKFPSCKLALPYINKFFKFPESLNFSEFLSVAHIAFDYSNQRLVIFRQDSEFAFIYSLLYKSWSLVSSNFRSSVNSYPDALVNTVNNALVNLSSPEPEALTPVCLVSRTLKLSSPDIFKSVYSLFLRGVFNRNDLNTILYGSRDLSNWHLVGSSVSNAIRNINGSPYKYFVVAAFGALKPSQSVSACSFQFNLKFINRPR